MSAVDSCKDFINDVIGQMRIDANVKVEEGEGNIKVLIEGEDAAILIGRDGQTLEALQLIVGIAVNKNLEERIRLFVDVGDYRKRRIENLKEHAINLAKKVTENGESIEMEPLNSFERRAIHMALRESTEVMTESQGEGTERHIVIMPL